MGESRDIEDLIVYRRLCDLHLEVCLLAKQWPREERFELTSQVLRSSNSSPAQLAEKNDDRHLRNKIEGVNRARGEAAETVHHLLIGMRKGYLDSSVFGELKERYTECIRMLNGLERNLEKALPEREQKWAVGEGSVEYKTRGYNEGSLLTSET